MKGLQKESAAAAGLQQVECGLTCSLTRWSIPYNRLAYSRRIFKFFKNLPRFRFARCAPSFSQPACGSHLVMHPWLLVAIMIAMVFVCAWCLAQHGAWYLGSSCGGPLLQRSFFNPFGFMQLRLRATFFLRLLKMWLHSLRSTVADHSSFNSLRLLLESCRHGLCLLKFRN